MEMTATVSPGFQGAIDAFVIDVLMWRVAVSRALGWFQTVHEKVSRFCMGVPFVLLRVVSL
jgi:hypothetical protein